MKTFKCSKSEKLSKFLLSAYDGGLSFGAFNKLLRKKDIKINGKRVSADLQLMPGDVVDVYFDGAFTPEVDSIYCDDNVLVVNKPKGMTSDSFYLMLKKGFPQLLYCHRLDRNTDGVMIFALNEIAYSCIVEGFKARTFEKFYTAEVYGRVKNDKEVLSAYLLKDQSRSLVEIFDRPTKGAKEIKTAYRVIDRKDETTILEVELLTGRTHQIRAHLGHIGHFIVGDGKYGREAINRRLGVKEMKLSSSKLILHFPSSSPLFYLDNKCFCLR